MYVYLNLVSSFSDLFVRPHVKSKEVVFTEVLKFARNYHFMFTKIV